MIWFLLIPLIILYFFIQSKIVESTGHAPRSRSSLRNQRRKANRLGVDPGDVDYNPRFTPMDEPQTETVKETIARYNWPFGIMAAIIWALLLEPWKWF